ncbi:MAG: Fluoride ion transporter CrcB [uncultured Rubrobacteraceae bacterium]|uniref:Fluoride-specific ion channel FluC n=1 Tax=uncultured Rubrobacteraceae bacterium TaxID=349277 RepID=A0A6J4S724_9ACTN|nr:MAG: Fluoride ion transporter CrcB [uncultured Rubrobacteraceae bacterium]
MANVALVAVGGGLGAAARYLAGLWIAARLGAGFPWGTFFVNVTGSFLIGLVLVLVGRGTLPAEARLFFAVGILGGYTTFSSFSYETLQLANGGDMVLVLLNTLGQVLAGLLAVYLGVVVGRAFLGGA